MRPWGSILGVDSIKQCPGSRCSVSLVVSGNYNEIQLPLAVGYLPLPFALYRIEQE